MRPAPEFDLVGLVERTAELANRDPVLARLGRHCRAELCLACNEAAAYLRIEDGAITAVVPGPRHLRSYRFRIRAGADAWRKFWSPEPPPGYHDVFAMARFGWAEIDGDLDPLLEHLPYFKRLLALPKALAG